MREYTITLSASISPIARLTDSASNEVKILRGETAKLTFTIPEGLASTTSKVRYLLKNYTGLGRTGSLQVLADEFNYDGQTAAVEIDASTSTAPAGLYLLSVFLIDADSKILNVTSGVIEFIETGVSATFSPNPQIRDDVLLAAAAAATSASNAANSADDAYNHKNAAAISEENASSYANNASQSASAASTSEGNASIYAGFAETSASTATSAKTDAEAAYDAAEIAKNQAESFAKITKVTLADAASLSIEANKCYVADCSAWTNTSITFAPQTPASDKLNQILIQLKTGTTAPSITWGTTHFFRSKIPVIEASSTYNIYYEYDFNGSNWVVGSIYKN